MNVLCPKCGTKKQLPITNSSKGCVNYKIK